ncbi:MAG: hypothetical protein Q8P55_01230, partial [bacterium]|nr:hypothetical protein [bacterium]
IDRKERQWNPIEIPQPLSRRENPPRVDIRGRELQGRQKQIQGQQQEYSISKQFQQIALLYCTRFSSNYPYRE